MPKNRKNNLLDIQTDEDVLFNYKNKELNSYNKYCIRNKKENLIFDYHLDNKNTMNLNSEIAKHNDAINNNKNKDNLNLKKFRSEIIKRENETLLKKYEIYKNSDFESYEKKYMLEKSQNKSKNNDKEINKIPFSSDNFKKSKIELHKIIEKTEIKSTVTAKNTDDLRSDKIIIKEQADNKKNALFAYKNEKQIKNVKELKINFDDLKIREEKFNSLKQKLEKIKNHQKQFEQKLIDEKLKIEDSNVINTNQKTIEDKTIKEKKIKIRSISSKITSNKQTTTIKSKALNSYDNNQNSNSKNKNSLKISVEKEIQSLRKSKDSEGNGIMPENKNILLQQNCKILSNKNNNSKENISKEFKQVLNDLKIDNILQKTKMIFNKQLTLNSNLSRSKVKNIKEFDLKNIKISSNIILSNEEEKDNNHINNNNFRSSLEKINKKPKSDNVITNLVNPELKRSTEDKTKNSNNYINPTTPTIIINNNININTFLDKGDLIIQNEMDNYKLNNNIHNNKQNKNISSNRNNYNYYKIPDDNNNNYKKENSTKYTNENQNFKLNKLRNSEDNFDKASKINREKLISNLNPNSNWERKESSINKKIPSSTKDIKREYSDNNYKNLLLCSYEIGIKNSEFKLEYTVNNNNNYYSKDKDYERIKDNLKKYESVEKYLIEKPRKNINNQESYNFNKNRNNRNQNYADLNYRDDNISPSYFLKNHKMINRPFSHFGSLDFDNKTCGVDYLLYNEKEKTKPPALNFSD